MMILKDILNQVPVVSVKGKSDAMVTDLCIDSRKVTTGSLYAALPGTQVDGHAFIEQAIEKGATVVLCKDASKYANQEVSYVVVDDVPAALGLICGNYFHHPATKMKVVGVTGTNGKTTVTTLLYNLFQSLGSICGLISTVEYRIGHEVFPSTHTTPDVISVYRLLSKMVDAGCTHCFMEVSSHAADQKRIAGIEFCCGVFTNITHDHLDYHKTFDAYIKAKKSFFDQLPASAFALTNKDDRNGMIMTQNTRASRYTYGLHGNADFNARILESDFNGTLIQIDQKEIWVSLVGEFNAYNLAAVYATAFLLSDGKADLAVALSALPRVNGRFEAIQGPKKITAIVDYAHTPDALENVLQTIEKIRTKGENIITVIGCGGNRDKTKRPEMGKISARMSNKVIFTSDNPRDEVPEQIISEMEQGVEGQHFKKILKITDRKEAIRTAAMLAQPGDVILIAGKGHETYQEIKGIKYPFDDKVTIAETFKQMS